MTGPQFGQRVLFEILREVALPLLRNIWQGPRIVLEGLVSS